MKRKSKRLVMLIIGIGLCIMSGCTKAKPDAVMQKAPDVKAEKTDDEDVYTLRISNVQTGASPIGQAVDYMIQMAEERSGGRLKFEHYPGATLWADRVNIENAQADTLEIGNSSMSFQA